LSDEGELIDCFGGVGLDVTVVLFSEDTQTLKERIRARWDEARGYHGVDYC
jgi:hypothetical protein